MKELLTEWRKFVNEGTGADLYKVPFADIVASFIDKEVSGEDTESDNLIKSVSILPLRRHRMRLDKWRFRKQYITDPELKEEDIDKVLDDMLIFSKWIEKSFYDWKESGQDEDEGSTLANKVRHIGSDYRLLRSFAPALAAQLEERE